MDYARVFSPDASESDLHELFCTTLSEQKFSWALAAAAESSWKSKTQNPSVQRLLKYGVQLLAEVALPQENRPAHQVELDSPAAKRSRDSPESLDDDGEDITSLGARAEPAASFVEVAIGSENGDRETSGRSSVSNAEAGFGVLTPGARSKFVTQIASVLRLWFAGLYSAAKSHNMDTFGLLFGLPGTSSALTEQHLYELVATIKAYLDEVLEHPAGNTDSIREVILLVHEILRGIFAAVALERNEQGSNRFFVLKSLLVVFFRADLSNTIHTLLAITCPNELFEERQEEDYKVHEWDERNGPAPLRLSYETLMKVFVIWVSLANCPLNMLHVNKVSLSLDITTMNQSPNQYANFISQINFHDLKIMKELETRVIPLLAAMFNYYYDLTPDLLNHSLRHASFLGWMIGHRLSPGLYLAWDTTDTVTFFPANVLSDEIDPYLREVHKYEYTAKLVSFSTKTSEAAVRAPSYLVVTLLFYQLVNNQNFVTTLFTPSHKQIVFIDIWLCVSSYVLHYQYRSQINDFLARLCLLILLKLTSADSESLAKLREHEIQEHKWKLCHHRHPVVPTDNTDGNKAALTYIIDVLQVSLRFNLTRKLDLENSKLALSVLYQILIEAEARPFDGLNVYKWNELYKTLVQFLTFLSKNFNEEDVKYVIEEIFALFEVILGPSFDRVLEKSKDFFVIGRHWAKSINYDLLYIMLRQHAVISDLFERYIVKKNNFSRVQSTLNKLSETFDLQENRERDDSEVRAVLNNLSILSTEDTTLTTLHVDDFNYAGTFKYVSKFQAYVDFEKQIEIIDMFNLVFENNWIPRG